MVTYSGVKLEHVRRVYSGGALKRLAQPRKTTGFSGRNRLANIASGNVNKTKMIRASRSTVRLFAQASTTTAKLHLSDINQRRYKPNYYTFHVVSVRVGVKLYYNDNERGTVMCAEDPSGGSSFGSDLLRT